MNHLVKQLWITRCLEVHKFHIQQCRDEPSWTLEQTARLLNRSIGSVSQDITIAIWMKTHESQIRKFRNRIDALDFIKKAKREKLLGE